MSCVPEHHSVSTMLGRRRVQIPFSAVDSLYGISMPNAPKCYRRLSRPTLNSPLPCLPPRTSSPSSPPLRLSSSSLFVSFSPPLLFFSSPLCLLTLFWALSQNFSSLVWRRSLPSLSRLCHFLATFDVAFLTSVHLHCRSYRLR